MAGNFDNCIDQLHFYFKNQMLNGGEGNHKNVKKCPPPQIISSCQNKILNIKIRKVEPWSVSIFYTFESRTKPWELDLLDNLQAYSPPSVVTERLLMVGFFLVFFFNSPWEENKIISTIMRLQVKVKEVEAVKIAINLINRIFFKWLFTKSQIRP